MAPAGAGERALAAPPPLGPALGGQAGYRRLIRLLVRAFYSGECPPLSAEEEEAVRASQQQQQRQLALAPDATPTQRLALAARARHKHSFAGLGVVLLDYLTQRVDGYADETQVCEDLRMSQKHVRRALRYLSEEQLVSSESVRYAYKRALPEGETDDDPELRRKRVETRVFWAIDYARAKDASRLRLARLREALRGAAEGSEALAQYVCSRCGATFSSLHAARLLDPRTGEFRCDECGGPVVPEGATPAPPPRGQAGGDAGDAGPAPSSAQYAPESRSAARDRLARLEAQLAPISEQLLRLRDDDPPDPGTLRDWFAAAREAAVRRQTRAEEARAKAVAEARARDGAGGGGAGGAGAGYGVLDLGDEGALADIAAEATVEISVRGPDRAGAGDDDGAAGGGAAGGGGGEASVGGAPGSTLGGAPGDGGEGATAASARGIGAGPLSIPGGKELPSWFRRPDDEAEVARGGDAARAARGEAAPAADAASRQARLDAEEEAERNQAAYLAQYMAAVKAAASQKAAVEAGASGSPATGASLGPGGGGSQALASPEDVKAPEPKVTDPWVLGAEKALFEAGGSNDAADEGKWAGDVEDEEEWEDA